MRPAREVRFVESKECTSSSIRHRKRRTAAAASSSCSFGFKGLSWGRASKLQVHNEDGAAFPSSSGSRLWGESKSEGDNRPARRKKCAPADGRRRALETRPAAVFSSARALMWLCLCARRRRAHTDDKCLAAPFGAGCVIHSLRLGAPGMTHIRLFFILRSLLCCICSTSRPPSAHAAAFRALFSAAVVRRLPTYARSLLAAFFVRPKLSPLCPQLAPDKLLSHFALLIWSSESIRAHWNEIIILWAKVFQ